MGCRCPITPLPANTLTDLPSSEKMVDHDGKGRELRSSPPAPFIPFHCTLPYGAPLCHVYGVDPLFCVNGHTEPSRLRPGRTANMAPLPFILVVDGQDLNRSLMSMPYVPMENEGVLCLYSLDPSALARGCREFRGEDE